jgi:hypothetical protein
MERDLNLISHHRAAAAWSLLRESPRHDGSGVKMRPLIVWNSGPNKWAFSTTQSMGFFLIFRYDLVHGLFFGLHEGP